MGCSRGREFLLEGLPLGSAGSSLAGLLRQAVLDRLVEEFGIRVDLTEEVGVSGLREGSKVFRVRLPGARSEVYVVDTLAGKDIACHPSIVGEELWRLSLEAALDAARAILELTPLGEVGWGSVVFEHVLRAAPGYKLHEALRVVEPGAGFREVWVRPRYVTPSYRDHDEEAAKRLVVVYEDFSQLPEGVELTVLKPDTEASGRTGTVALERLAAAAEERGSGLGELVVYGFVSEPGLRAVEEVALRLGFRRTYFFAVGNLTALCHNLYDMPLYGPDESYYSEHGGVKLLGGVADYSTLERYALEFIPGADQPGDWSARQSRVYTGTGWEPGGIEKHLRNSVHLIERLWEICRGQPWFMEFHEEAIKRELEALRRALAERGARA